MWLLAVCNYHGLNKLQTASIMPHVLIVCRSHNVNQLSNKTWYDWLYNMYECVDVQQTRQRVWRRGSLPLKRFFWETWSWWNTDRSSILCCRKVGDLTEMFKIKTYLILNKTRRHSSGKVQKKRSWKGGKDSEWGEFVTNQSHTSVKCEDIHTKHMFWWINVASVSSQNKPSCF